VTYAVSDHLRVPFLYFQWLKGFVLLIGRKVTITWLFNPTAVQVLYLKIDFLDKSSLDSEQLITGRACFLLFTNFEILKLNIIFVSGWAVSPNLPHALFHDLLYVVQAWSFSILVRSWSHLKQSFLVYCNFLTHAGIRRERVQPDRQFSIGMGCTLSLLVLAWVLRSSSAISPLKFKHRVIDRRGEESSTESSGEGHQQRSFTISKPGLEEREHSQGHFLSQTTSKWFVVDSAVLSLF